MNKAIRKMTPWEDSKTILTESVNPICNILFKWISLISLFSHMEGALSVPISWVVDLVRHFCPWIVELLDTFPVCCEFILNEHIVLCVIRCNCPYKKITLIREIMWKHVFLEHFTWSHDFTCSFMLLPVVTLNSHNSHAITWKRVFGTLHKWSREINAVFP